MAFLDNNGVETLVSTLKTKIANAFASKSDLGSKQDVLVSGTNIKTVNSNSLIGSGNISVEDKDAYRLEYDHEGYGSFQAKTVLYPKNIVFTALDGTLISSAKSSGINTNKSLATDYFNPFGPIYYYDGVNSVSANNYVSGEYLKSFGLVQAQYAFNVPANNWVKGRPVYLTCYMLNNTARISSITQTLPNGPNGLVYIMLGIARGTGSGTGSNDFYLTTSHPIYYYAVGSGVRLYLNQPPLNGSNVLQLEIQDWGNEYVLLDGSGLFDGQYFVSATGMDYDAIEIFITDDNLAPEFNGVERRRYYFYDYSELTTDACIYKDLGGQNNIIIDYASEASSITIEGHTFTIDSYYNSWTCPHN